jgi:cytochrome c556
VSRLARFVLGGLLLGTAALAFAQHSHDSGNRDARSAVAFPAQLRQHTLSNMRDHLQALAQIQGYLAAHDFDRAAEVAEFQLGMSSLSLHGAHEVAQYMPKGMQDAGTAMHRSASRFAVTAKEASIDHDVARALGALNVVTQACVACHAGYRLE